MCLLSEGRVWSRTSQDSLVVPQHATVTQQAAIMPAEVLSLLQGAIKGNRYTHTQHLLRLRKPQMLEQTINANALQIPFSTEAQHRKLREE